ncbi:MAG: redox-regulated ATPase YchF [Candidatus Eisenbacteria bacterium]|nr:redox-regulated ATPase YchF [Candidatus Eisenbacteria bacterium]
MKRVGILGLPQSGKTTLFQILMQGAGSASPSREQVGVVRVPDERVDRLSALYQPKKTTHTQIQFVDSAAAGGVSARSAAKGADLFGSVRSCDCLVLIVRDFTLAGEAPHAARDLDALEAELILNDLAIVENRLEKVAKELRIGRKQNEAEHRLLERCKRMLEAEQPLSGGTFLPEEMRTLRGFQLLSLKPRLVVYNQDDASSGARAAPSGRAMAVALKAHLEREIVSLPPAERETFRRELGIEDDGLSLVIRACYELLGLISFLTVGPDEVRAWEIRRGEKAVEAAGEIHSDLAKGFIRAEVIEWERLIEAGGHAKAREKGWLRLEGRDYEVCDGDCLEIRFNK